ncbi:hypothetical protein ANCCAN_06953 [Ancylostoma caninum]|uniref:Cysteine rich repeat-containing domain protein n=1 Tax=Ancylostoma caninum TaxID=29170 RepID=A0A368GRM2_ANCCA|nr:hypothetical protein ANCCAN_06953 [Ancylostoma caninum]
MNQSIFIGALAVWAANALPSINDSSAIRIWRAKRQCAFGRCREAPICTMCPTCCAAPPPPLPMVDVAVPCCSARPQAPLPLPPPPPAPSTVQCCKAAPVPLNPCCQAIVASPEPVRTQCCLSAPTPNNPCCQEALPTTCVCQMPRPVPCRCAAPPSEMECNGCMLPPPRYVPSNGKTESV